MNGATQDGGKADRRDMNGTQNGRWIIRQKPWVAKQQRISQFAAAFVPYIGCEVKNDGIEIPRDSSTSSKYRFGTSASEISRDRF